MSSATLNGVAPVAAAQRSTPRVMAPMRATEASTAAGWLGYLAKVRQADRHPDEVLRHMLSRPPRFRRCGHGATGTNHTLYTRFGGRLSPLSRRSKPSELTSGRAVGLARWDTNATPLMVSKLER